MKKIAIIFLCFFLFACEKQNPTIEPEEIKIENISHKENPHQKCADNSPLKANNLPKIYWAFENENDKKCWYLGYIDRNFFLTNEDDYFVPYATGENFDETEYKKGEWENFDGNYGSVLYSDSGSAIQELAKEFYELSFHELPSFHIYFPNVDEKFLQKFAENSIILPENPLKIIEGKTEKAFDESFSDDIASFLKQDFQKDIENILQDSTLQSENNDEKLKAIGLTAKEITEISLKRFEKRKQQQEIIKNSILTNIKISDLYNFLREKQKSNTNGEKIISEKENAKICIQKLDKNFFEENKNKGSNATLQAFQHNTNCYYILIEKNTLPLYLVFSFDDTSGTKNSRNGAYYFFDSINIQDFDGHDYTPIQGDFINSLDNLLIENNLSIPKISYNLEDDLKNGYFISNSIEEANYENILKKIWEYRNSENYFEQKKFFKNENKKFLENMKYELQNLKECGINCEKRYKKIYEQYIKAQKILGE